MKNSMVIDLSHWNEANDWNAVRTDGVVAVIHKFSQGSEYRDETYAERRRGALAAGLLWGRYHFGDNSDVTAQIANALDGIEDGDLFALDWENNGNETMSLAQAEDFMTRAAAALRGKCVPVLYTGGTAKDQLAGTPSETLSRYRLWLAHYTGTPVCPPGWSEPWLWQWSDNGSIAGIVGDVDTDSFNGSQAELVTTWTGDKREVPDTPARPTDSSEAIVMVGVVIPVDTRRD